MADPTRALTLQLLQSLAERPRPYAEVLETWRTSCPRLSIWEDACIDGLVDCAPDTHLVTVSARGRALLAASAETTPWHTTN
ncbi:hypothetical protein [Ralstonia solanacearum]|uniref:hypothetical protein n=1 Tax=Ralstonia solanacearum TaxID=305 RepID=UPI00078C2CA1|nr:hypothetical protein [Ralstonia solanacearum]AMP36107.1 hypothetical protein LBM2029_00465 [Ralstonia solanacearum]AXV84901.1 hypothetical protein CJO78_00480 [Ralstonia solanacearum]AXW04452.1 hypothetical protein CJO82_00480 [Ralstonia solanacearum]AXW22204.1 hypothetical protein CJO86_00480 [Ralstonia solanacearum]AXW79101.1 hypothetical protein CJO98_00480 [Ralstonia solanacearum]